VALQSAVGLGVSRYFSQLTVEDITDPDSDAVEEWLEKSTVLIQNVRDRSVALGRDYFDDVREVVVPNAEPFTHDTPEPAPLEQIRTSLFVMGVVGARNRIKKTPEARTFEDPSRQRQSDLIQRGTFDDILALSGQEAGAAASRIAADGGREQVKVDVQADRRALGWIRITRGVGTCYFCAMLASRGPVYQEDSFDESDVRFEGPGRHKVHDNCSCSLRAVFTRSTAEIPQWNFDQIDAWRSLSNSLGRSPTANDWRVMYEGRASVA
jgi:hypothetical protein